MVFIIKFLTTSLLPLSIVGWLFWKLYKRWFINVVPSIVEDVKEINKASEKYDKKLK